MSGTGGSSARRVSVLATVFLAALGAVLVQLWVVMVEQHEEWLVRSYQNRWTFRDVPARRGPIVDRHGRKMAWDVPSFALHVHYRAFRRHHPVGVAVHGATLLARYSTPSTGPYSYLGGSRGPRPACRAMMAMPLDLLREQGGLPEPVRVDLRFYVTSLLAGCSDLEYRRVSSLVTEALEEGRAGAVTRVLPPATRAGLALVFEERWNEVESLEQELLRFGARSLLERLDDFRDRWEREEADDLHESRRRERWVLEVADGLPFGLAAALRLSDRRHPGLLLRPSVRREVLSELGEGHSLASLIGSVRPLDRLDEDLLERAMEQRRAELEDVAVRDRLLPDDVPLPELREDLEQRVDSFLDTVLRRRGRIGSSGLERANDDVLAGLPGMRLVGRDKGAREQVLYRNLDVAPGGLLVTTLDLDLQRHLELAVSGFYERLVRDSTRSWLEQGRQDELDSLLGYLDVALSVVDARTGDVLAVGGRPVEIEGVLRGHPPGFSWRSTGTLGSIFKPLILLEQLDAGTKGLTSASESAFAGCNGFYRVGGRRLTCMAAHHGAGTEAVSALAHSCNSYFYQVAEGLGQAGILRALVRFGLEGDVAGTPPAWQPHVLGVPAVISPRPRGRQGNYLIQQRAIGYGVNASALHVARAYAALATGRLPWVSLVRDDDRGSPVPLRVDPSALDTVRRGLRECVKSGSARKVEGLRAFEVAGKTGTAEVNEKTGDNNAWFAGYLPPSGSEGVQLAFCAVAYRVPSGFYGGEVAGELVADFLARVAADETTRVRYLSGN